MPLLDRKQGGAADAQLSLVVVGNGMAGMRAVEHLRETAPEKYDITVFGAEPHGNYNRILLSPYLAGDRTVGEIMLHDDDWYIANDIVLHVGDPIVQIDRVQRYVRSASGREVRYDRLLLATGSQPVVLPLPGTQLSGVVAFRNLADVKTMLAAARPGRKAVVIGGGVLGLEAAFGLLKQGMDVTVIHLMDRLMNQQLDQYASGLLKIALEEKGLRFLLATQTEEIVGAESVSGLQAVRAVRFRNDDVPETCQEIPAELVVMAVGVRPNIALALQAGLHCGRGIIVDDAMQTADSRISAVGECVEHKGTTFGLVAPLWEQAKVCAAHLAGTSDMRYSRQADATSLKVTGVDLYCAGDHDRGPDCEELRLRDRRLGIYKKLILKKDQLIGAILMGEAQDGPWYLDLIRQGTNIAGMRDHLLFGEALCVQAA